MPHRTTLWRQRRRAGLGLTAPPPPARPRIPDEWQWDRLPVGQLPAGMLAVPKLPPLPAWMSRAGCVGDLDGAWLRETSPPDPHCAEVCAGCPVRELCGAWATATRSSGVYGGVAYVNGRPASGR